MTALILALASLMQCPGGVCRLPAEAPMPSVVLHSSPTFAPAIVYQDGLTPVYQSGNTGIVPPWFQAAPVQAKPAYLPTPIIVQGYQVVPSHRLPLTPTRLFAPRFYGGARCGPGGCR
jgi:hypothetical protein